MGLVARLVLACPGPILICGGVLAALSVWVVLTRFNVINNTSDLLSDKSPQKQNFNELLRD